MTDFCVTLNIENIIFSFYSDASSCFCFCVINKRHIFVSAWQRHKCLRQIGQIPVKNSGRARSEPGGTRWRTGGEVKGKLANGVGSQYSQAISERGVSSITQADAHTSAASSRLNWRPHRFKLTRPFRGKTKFGFCACAIRFRTSYTYNRQKKYF